jgi:DNA-binding NarL/FixJ family response regulator
MLRTTTESAASPSSRPPEGRGDRGAQGLVPQRLTTGVLVADSDRFHAGFVARALVHEGFDPVLQAGTAHEALSLAGEADPKLVLVGPVPDQPLAELVHGLKQRSPDAVVLLAGEPESEEAAAAIRAGAQGIVSKRLELDAFTAVVRAAAEGRLVIVPGQLSEALGPALPPGPGPALSRRELEVLALLVRGRDNGAIAAELHISPSTAKGHVSHILEKLGSENRIAAAVEGIQRGLVRL